MSRSWLRVLLALAISFVYEKSGSAGPETPAKKAWPVIEPTIKDLAYAEKSPDEKLDLYLPAKESGPAFRRGSNWSFMLLVGSEKCHFGMQM
jgi:hypothetical protein